MARSLDIDSLTAQDRMYMVRELLTRLSAIELREVRNLAEETLASRLEEAKQEVIEEMRAKLGELGVEPEDITVNVRRPRTLRKDTGATLAPKYRGPEGQTWSGRGFVPNWLKALEEAGHQKDEFLVQDKAGEN
jgi:DNA-binding protein H-NS